MVISIQRLITEVEAQGVSWKRLPYTVQFERIREALNVPDSRHARQELWQWIVVCGQAGRLPAGGIAEPEGITS